MIPDVTDAEKGMAAGAGGTILADATVGLERAAQAAGDVLRGIMGGLPWEMDPFSIVEAVGGGSPETASMILEVGTSVIL